MVLFYNLTRFRGDERDHGIAMAPGAYAGFYSIPGDGVEERDEEYDRCREPEVGVDRSRQGEKERQTPEG